MEVGEKRKWDKSGCLCLPEGPVETAGRCGQCWQQRGSGVPGLFTSLLRVPREEFPRKASDVG